MAYAANRERIALPRDDVLARILRQQSVALASQQPRHTLGHFERIGLCALDVHGAPDAADERVAGRGSAALPVAVADRPAAAARWWRRRRNVCRQKCFG